MKWYKCIPSFLLLFVTMCLIAGCGPTPPKQYDEARQWSAETSDASVVGLAESCVALLDAQAAAEKADALGCYTQDIADIAAAARQKQLVDRIDPSDPDRDKKYTLEQYNEAMRVRREQYETRVAEIDGKANRVRAKVDLAVQDHEKARKLAELCEAWNRAGGDPTAFAFNMIMIVEKQLSKTKAESQKK